MGIFKNKKKIYIPSKWKVTFKPSQYINKKLNEKMNYILKTSVACGSYYASGKSLKTKSDFLKIKNLSKRVIVQYYAWNIWYK